MRILSALAQLCAVLAGILLTGITLVTCGNLIMRNTTGDANTAADGGDADVAQPGSDPRGIAAE